MDVFQWDQNFETGLAEVDQQHKHLVKVINEFGQLLSQNSVNSADLEQVFTELVSYTQYHFEEEEKMSHRTGVDIRHVEHHEREHLNFLQEVTLLHQQMETSQDTTGKDLFEFLMNWLVCHILGSDMSLARQIRAIEFGHSADDAYLMEEKAVDKATGLLLRSLNNLFKQVSNRNKQLSELNQTLEVKIRERTQSLSEANQKLGKLASTDVLTGLSNRRHALQILDQLWEESVNMGTTLACMMIDADGFKAINDNYGHDAGDLVLQKLARQLRYAVRTDDIVCRLGGDEFLIICPKTNEEGAMVIATLMHDQIAALTVPVLGGVWPGSISVGVAAKTAAMKTPEDLIKAADRGVYAAKNAGKNCVKIVR
ncbi:GGDEF domain-containing protein [Geopsychrobacter electrodiphilus]|uniref:GGDEF domain-containing protein n=1 Tax=Geopsychrobacter electrodiphilus TaxID=225196 RepID=UPI000379689B|nr:bacteriohemerythrin [Geopsychrobacter electrodiphilus]